MDVPIAGRVRQGQIITHKDTTVKMLPIEDNTSKHTAIVSRSAGRTCSAEMLLSFETLYRYRALLLLIYFISPQPVYFGTIKQTQFRI